MLQSNSPITQPQIISANSLAASGDLSIESKNDAPTSSEIVNWATVFGIALALGVLAMSVGLIRSETASDLRTLTATGASSRTRRSLTAVTAGGLAFLGALLGTVAAYVGLFGWFRSNPLEGGVGDIIDHVPWNNLFFILIAMPAVAILIGWVLAGRDPARDRHAADGVGRRSHSHDHPQRHRPGDDRGPLAVTGRCGGPAPADAGPLRGPPRVLLATFAASLATATAITEGWPHLAIGSAFVALVVVHVAQRRHTVARLVGNLARARTWVRRRGRLAWSDLVLSLLTLNVLVSGTYDLVTGNQVILHPHSVGIPFRAIGWHVPPRCSCRVSLRARGAPLGPHPSFGHPLTVPGRPGTGAPPQARRDPEALGVEGERRAAARPGRGRTGPGRTRPCRTCPAGGRP